LHADTANGNNNNNNNDNSGDNDDDNNTVSECTWIIENSYKIAAMLCAVGTSSV